jgi:hypothetical protein
MPLGFVSQQSSGSFRSERSVFRNPFACPCLWCLQLVSPAPRWLLAVRVVGDCPAISGWAGFGVGFAPICVPDANAREKTREKRARKWRDPAQNGGFWRGPKAPFRLPESVAKVRNYLFQMALRLRSRGCCERRRDRHLTLERHFSRVKSRIGMFKTVEICRLCRYCRAG